jgi:Holliday junction resolvasome RuvABC endonuclease subunit
MNGPVVIGLDPSLTGTGIADGNGVLSTVGGDADDPDRLNRIYTAIVQVASGVALAVVEDLPTHARGAGLTGMAQGVVRLALIHTGVPYVTVTAATLKKYATGSGNAGKPDLRMAMFKRSGQDVRDDNQVDAWWLRQIGLRAFGSRHAIELPKLQVDALRKIKNWPDSVLTRDGGL